MARTVELPSETVASLVRQVGAFLPAAGIRLMADDTPELGETLQVWMLPASAVISPNPLDAATPTGRWHHQIYRRGKPELFAYSQPFGPRAEDWQITAAFESDVPAAIDQAIDIVDDAFTGDEEARLLVIPAYNIQAIWVRVSDTENRIVPAVVPTEYRGTIEPLTIMDAPGFFAKLQTVRHIEGIVP